MAELVVYTKDDFLSGTAPYEEVYKYIEDPFELGREIERMASVAKLAGVSNFKTLFKAYADKMKHAANPDLIENASDFDGQPMELNTGSWLADDHGISRINAWGVEIFACVHPIMPIERLINVDTGIAKIKLAFKLASWETCIVDKKTIASATSIVSLADYGIAVTSENARELVQYLHDVEYLNYTRIPTSHSITRLGWIKDKGFSPYIKDLSYDGESSFLQMFEAVSKKGSSDTWLDLAKEIRTSGNIPTKIMLAASFASALVEPLGCLPFFVHLWGGTETGKTVGLMLATSVWADPEMGKFCKTFNATAVSQELTAGFVNSLPLIMDELQLEKERKSFDKMIYQLAEGVGRSRGMKTGGLQKVQTWRNCILTTGEQPMTSDISGGGAMNRIIEINCEDTKLFKDPVRVSAVVKENYGHAGEAFISLLTDEIIELAREVYNDNYSALLKDSTEKQAMAGALVLVADQITSSLIFKDGKELKTDDISQFLLNKDDVNVNRHALEWLRGWLVQNSSKFEWLDSDQRPEIWGRRNQGNTMIFNHVFNKACEAEGYNSRSFARWLVRYGFLIPDSKGRSTKVCNIYGSRVRCYVFRDTEEGNEW